MLQYFTTVYEKKLNDQKQPLFEIVQRRGTIYLPPELCTMIGIPANIRENKRTMAEIRQSLFQKPSERIESIMEVGKMISNNSVAKTWDLELNVEPDQCEAKILPRPSIFTQDKERSLDDTRILNTIVTEPIHFKKWAVFCLDQDLANG